LLFHIVQRTFPACVLRGQPDGGGVYNAGSGGDGGNGEGIRTGCG
jgi:hypothetical protein